MPFTTTPDPLVRPPAEYPDHWGGCPLMRASAPLALGTMNPVSLAICIGMNPPAADCRFLAESVSIGVFGSLLWYFLAVGRQSEDEPVRLVDCGRWAIMGEMIWQATERAGLDPGAHFINRETAAGILDRNREDAELGDPWLCNLILDRYCEQLAAYRAGLSPEGLAALIGRGGSLLGTAPSVVHH